MFKTLKAGIAKTRNQLMGRLGRLVTRREPLDTASLESLEAALLQADVGVAASERLVSAVKQQAARRPGVPLGEMLKGEMCELLTASATRDPILNATDSPYVVLVVGVNGAGKTTTIAKLGHYYQGQGKRVIFAAGDTFRAAAVDQLKRWGERLNIPVIAQGAGADAASVIYDAYSAAKSRAVEVLIADTAGRLHTQSGLMNELSKIRRVLAKQSPHAPQETMLILDGTLGQNSLNQAQQFRDAAAIDSVVLTKLDGTAKGGILFAITASLALPIRFIGIGEQCEDLRVFVPAEFVAALLSTEHDEELPEA